MCIRDSSDVLEKAGMGYDVMEAGGVISPVLEAHAIYRSMTRYGEQVKIAVKIKAYNGIRLSITYEVVDAAVSYTHLDVYKRQFCMWLIFFGAMLNVILEEKTGKRS